MCKSEGLCEWAKSWFRVYKSGMKVWKPGKSVGVELKRKRVGKRV